MDFEIIEGLSDEDINKIYENVINDDEDILISHCECNGASGTVYTGGPPVFSGSNAYCNWLRSNSMLFESNASYTCSRWCLKQGFTLKTYSTDCCCTGSYTCSYYNHYRRC